jgi:hypothetical protein
VIEGEGLGGIARRVTVNDSAEGLFRPRIAELPENSKAVGAPRRLTALPSSPSCRVLGRHPLVCRTAR